MRISGRDAMRTRAGARKVYFFSKKWNPGDTAIVIYPVAKEEDGTWGLTVGAVWGHKVDMGAINLKTSFLPSLTEIDDQGNIIGTPDITYQFSRIAKAFVDGQKAAELAELREKNIPSEEMRDQAKRTILDKYDKNSDSQDKVQPAVSPLTFKISTECIYIPMVNGVPKTEDAQLVAQDMSDSRMQAIYSLLNDEKFAPDEECPFLQVQYSFPTGTKQQAGKAQPVGLTKDYRLETRYPDAYRALKSVIATLPDGDDASDLIVRRNRNYTKFSEAQIKQALSTYCIMSSQYLDALDAKLDEDMINRLAVNNAVLTRLEVIPTLKSEDLITKIKEEIEKSSKTQAPIAEEKDIADNVSTGENINMQGMAPTIQDMLSQPHLGSDEDIENIDLM